MFRLSPVNPAKGLSKELERRIQELRKPVAARIRVPETVKWWFWQEFGVGTRRRAVAQYNVPGPRSKGYIIEVVNAKLLSFPNVSPSGSGYDLPLDPTNPENVIAPVIPIDPRNKLSHPGYEPRYMIRSILTNIRAFSGKTLLRSLLDRNYNMDAVKQDLMGGVLPNVLDQIAQSFNENLNNYDRLDGRLEGEAAGDAFRRQATIDDTSSETKVEE